MSIKNRKELSASEIRTAISNSKTMNGAAKYLRVDWRTFRWNAEKYSLYKPAPNKVHNKIPIEDIFAGLHPEYTSGHLSKRIVKEGYKEYVCERCGITDWMGERITLELNHKDGNGGNHKLENLELLCPNCHSQTKTYRNKRGKNGS